MFGNAGKIILMTKEEIFFSNTGIYVNGKENRKKGCTPNDNLIFSTLQNDANTFFGRILKNLKLFESWRYCLML